MTVDDVINRILDDEGGIADVGDGKGITRFGQTPDWLSDHGLPVPKTREDAFTNYRTWMRRTPLIGLIQKNPFIGWVVADHAVNGGLTTAVKILQRCLGVRDDGILGPVTLATVPIESPALARAIVAARNEEYGRLLSSDLIDRRKFARGWTARMGRFIRALP